MIKIMRKDIARLQRENDRLKSRMNEITTTEGRPFTAEKPYQAGEIITDGARVYIANQVIVQGETVIPGVNCTQTTVADVLNALQSKED